MLVDLIFIVAAIAVLIAIYKLKFSNENIQREIQEATQKEQINQAVSQKRKQTSQKDHQQETVLESAGASAWSNEDEEEEEEQSDEEMDRKKMLRKQQKQKEKQERKEAHEYFLEQEKEKRQRYEKQVEQRERLQEEKRRKEEEVIAQLREEERRRKEEEFNKWKDMFSVDEEGKQKLSAEEEKRKQDAFNNQLVALIRKHKLVLLQDLSHKYKMPTKQMVEKIKQLESQQLVSGIFDERGKYLLIETGEWEAVKNYISARGRVKKTEIMTECARLIKIPDEVEEDLLGLINVQEEKGSN